MFSPQALENRAFYFLGWYGNFGLLLMHICLIPFLKEGTIGMVSVPSSTFIPTTHGELVLPDLKADSWKSLQIISTEDLLRNTRVYLREEPVFLILLDSKE